MFGLSASVSLCSVYYVSLKAILPFCHNDLDLFRIDADHGLAEVF